MIYSVQLTIPCRGVNPNFKRGEPISPENPDEIVLPVGHVIKHEEAWKLCLPEPGTEKIRAKPDDDQTETKVKIEMSNRAAMLRRRLARGGKVAEDAARQLREIHGEAIDPSEIGPTTPEELNTPTNNTRPPRPQRNPPEAESLDTE